MTVADRLRYQTALAREKFATEDANARSRGRSCRPGGAPQEARPCRTNDSGTQRETMTQASHVVSRQWGGAMEDTEVLSRINELARQEHELFERESHANVSDADRERLRRIQVTLDQCWDLLR